MKQETYLIIEKQESVDGISFHCVWFNLKSEALEYIQGNLNYYKSLPDNYNLDVKLDKDGDLNYFKCGDIFNYVKIINLNQEQIEHLQDYDICLEYILDGEDEKKYEKIIIKAIKDDIQKLIDDDKDRDYYKD